MGLVPIPPRVWVRLGRPRAYPRSPSHARSLDAPPDRPSHGSGDPDRRPRGPGARRHPPLAGSAGRRRRGHDGGRHGDRRRALEHRDRPGGWGGAAPQPGPDRSGGRVLPLLPLGRVLLARGRPAVVVSAGLLRCARAGECAGRRLRSPGGSARGRRGDRWALRVRCRDRPPGLVADRRCRTRGLPARSRPALRDERRGPGRGGLRLIGLPRALVASQPQPRDALPALDPARSRGHTRSTPWTCGRCGGSHAGARRPGRASRDGVLRRCRRGPVGARDPA